MIYNFLCNQKEIINRIIFIVGLFSMFSYALEGIIYKNIFCYGMDIETKYFATASFIPFIIGAVMVIAYYLCLKFLPKNIGVYRNNIGVYRNNEKEAGNTVNESSTTDLSSEVSKIELLTKYKELNSQGILSDEEFDAKKKQLLNL